MRLGMSGYHPSGPAGETNPGPSLSQGRARWHIKHGAMLIGGLAVSACYPFYQTEGMHGRRITKASRKHLRSALGY